MKKITLFIISCSLVSLASAQGYINYQGVARNATGQPLAAKTIGVTTTIISDYPSPNTTHYSEVRSVTTNQFGLFSFQIGSPGAYVYPTGGAVPPEATFFIIPWINLINPRLKVAIDIGNGAGSIDLGTTRLSNVPFASLADNARRARPWTTTNTTISPDQPDWNLGLGTNTATQKLHIVGKIRIQDGSAVNGYVLETNASGVGTWMEPAWAKITFGSRHELVASDPTRKVGIGIDRFTPLTANLHVAGTLRFVTGDQGANKVLSSDAFGNARWRNMSELTGGMWYTQPGSVGITAGHPGSFYMRSHDSATFILTKAATQISPTLMEVSNWEDAGAYALNVRSPGSNGIAVGIRGTSSSDKKFITFFDNSGVKGRIEGQTADEIVNSREFIMFNFFRSTILAEYIAEGVAAGFQIDLFEVAVNAAAATALGIEWGIQVGDWQIAAGVAYQSGSGDYAEWLEKINPSEKFTYGDIVEVNGGKISKNITGKGTLMVISMAPIVLGNMPDPAKEKLYEKVAFMGQVPVKVRGKVDIGDYIISGGANDGLGYAVNPSNITPQQYKNAVGVAWSASSGAPLSFINTAVGLNTHGLTDRIAKQEEEINSLKSMVNQVSAYLQTKDTSFKYAALQTTAPAQVTKTEPVEVQAKQPAAGGNVQAYDLVKYTSTVTSEKVKKIIEEKPEYLIATWNYLRENFEEQAKNKNISLESNPQLKRMLYDKDFFIQTVKKAYNIK